MNKIKLIFIVVLMFAIIAFSNQVKADFIRLKFDIALELPLTKMQEDKLSNLKAVIADLESDLKAVINLGGQVIEPSYTLTHICRHDLGLSCIEEKTLKDTDFTKINPTSMPTPK